MDFAEKQLLKYGWSKGQGLGKRKDGILEPIRVKLKRDTCGVGSTPGADITCNWWDRAFNLAADNIKVKENGKGGVYIEAPNDTALSMKKKHYGLHRRELSYGGFLESTSVQCSLPDNAVGSGCGGNTEEDESERKEIVRERMKEVLLTDSLLFEACGGRTAHKGARHGLTLSGKLARIHEQETAAAAAALSTEGSKVTLKGEGGQKEQRKGNKRLGGEEVSRAGQLRTMKRQKRSRRMETIIS